MHSGSISPNGRPGVWCHPWHPVSPRVSGCPLTPIETHLGLMESCMACDLANGALLLPGGRIHETRHWLVEHCVGPLGLGTLIVKPERHVTSVAALTDVEAAELGPLLQRASAVAAQLVGAEQVYNCLWSHAGASPVHIHYVVQPVKAGQMAEFGAYGPSLQVAMFSRWRAAGIGDRRSRRASPPVLRIQVTSGCSHCLGSGSGRTRASRRS